MKIRTRIRLAIGFRQWPWRIPAQAALIGLERPPEHVFDEFRRIHGLER